MKIPLARPDITKVERGAVLEVLAGPYLCLGNKGEYYIGVFNYGKFFF